MSRRILLVDDNDDVRALATLSLARVGGHDVHAVDSGAACLDELTRWAPEVIVLDVMMPGMDGPSTMQRIRGNPETAHIPVVFLTASIAESELEPLRRLGATGLLSKPFDPLRLAADLAAIVGWD